MNRKEKCRKIIGKGMWHTSTGLHLSDGPHGLRSQSEHVIFNNKSHIATCFPTASCIANGWDTNLVREMSGTIAKEALAEKVAVVLGPGINMKRSPLCGRNFEYYSEDPFLAGSLASAYVDEMQSYGVGCSLKHFAVNSQETHRMTSDSRVDERALREIYLKAFEMTVKAARPATIMASYNKINGYYACENKHLLTDILRNEWGYEGLVMSDWGACIDLAAALKAGMDLEMPDSGKNHLKDLMAVGEDAELDNALDRAGTALDKLTEQHVPKEDVNAMTPGCAAHHELARKIAGGCAVLLKNNNLLPLETEDKLLIIGDLGIHTRIQGGGSSHIHTNSVKSLVDVFKELGADVISKQGYDAVDNQVRMDLEEEVMEEVIKASGDNRKIIFCGGLTDYAEGEGYDRKSFDMPLNQIHLLKKIEKVMGEDSGNLIFVSYGGSPYDISPADFAGAILSMYLAGEASAEAAADILTGRVNPSGKLAETWPMTMEDTPCYKNFATGSDEVKYKESIFIGYRYYDFRKMKVRYPFGYGLSYTQFEYSDLQVMASGDNYLAEVKIRNTGLTAGSEVAEFYVVNPEGDFLREPKKLAAFSKIFLQPDEEKTVKVTVKRNAFEIYDMETGAPAVPEGIYKIAVGGSSDNLALSKELEIKGIKITHNDRENTPSYFGEDFAITDEDFEKLCSDTVGRPHEEGKYSMKSSLTSLAKDSLKARKLLKFIRKLLRILYHGKDNDDPEFMMAWGGIAEGTIDLVVNQSHGIISKRKALSMIEEANKNLISKEED